MAGRYIFDKRDMKKRMKNYGIRFLIALPFVLIVEILTSHMNIWASLGLGALTCIAVLLIIEVILRIAKSNDNKTDTEQNVDKNKKNSK